MFCFGNITHPQNKSTSWFFNTACSPICQNFVEDHAATFVMRPECFFLFSSPLVLLAKGHLIDFANTFGDFPPFVLSLFNVFCFFRYIFFEGVAKCTIKPSNPALFLSRNLLIISQMVFSGFYFIKNSCFFANQCQRWTEERSPQR